MKPVAALAGLVALAFVFVPSFRQFVSVIGFAVLTVFGLVVLGLVLFGIYRLATPERRMQSMAGNAFTLPSFVPAEKSEGNAPEPQWKPETSSTAEFIEQVRSMDWFQFEKLVGHVYRKHGYNVTHRGGANPDGGIDLIIDKDGQCKAVQCKQWKRRDVGVRAIRELLGMRRNGHSMQAQFAAMSEPRVATGPRHHVSCRNGEPVRHPTCN